jgi:hypothetical protein
MTQIILNLLGKLDFSRNAFSAAVPALASVLPADTSHEASNALSAPG